MSDIFQKNEQDKNAFDALKNKIDATHPEGWFVAIADDQAISASADFHDLEGKLRALGKDPRDILVVQAGVTQPERATIFI